MNSRRLVGRLAPALLITVLAAAVLVPSDLGLRLASGNDEAVARWSAAMRELPDGADVLVGFDPDLGTYAEIRPTVRAVLAELLSRQSRLAFVSLTPEGRALALGELARLDRDGANTARIADLGFVPGAEAALVRLTRALPEPVGDGSLGRRFADEGIGTMEAILVVGGNDLGPRSWVEQVVPRIAGATVLAVAPTVLLPELLPYEATGQLDALVGTVRDGAVYRAATELGTFDRLVPPEAPTAVAILVGTVVAIVALGQAILATLVRSARGERERR